jgi:hypothetical protein
MWREENVSGYPLLGDRAYGGQAVGTSTSGLYLGELISAGTGVPCMRYRKITGFFPKPFEWMDAQLAAREI